MRKLNCQIKEIIKDIHGNILRQNIYDNSYIDRAYLTNWEDLYTLFTVMYAPLMEGNAERQIAFKLDNNYICNFNSENNALINVIFLNASDRQPYMVSRKQGEDIRYEPDYLGVHVDFSDRDSYIRTIKNLIEPWKYPSDTNRLDIILVKDRDLFDYLCNSKEMENYFIIGTEMEM